MRSYYPVEKTVLSDRRIILSLAEKEIIGKLNKLEKRITKLSDRLKDAFDQNSTIRKRANLRTKLSLECQERDRWNNRLEEIERMKVENSSISD